MIFAEQEEQPFWWEFLQALLRREGGRESSPFPEASGVGLLTPSQWGGAPDGQRHALCSTGRQAGRLRGALVFPREEKQDGSPSLQLFHRGEETATSGLYSCNSRPQRRGRRNITRGSSTSVLTLISRWAAGELRMPWCSPQAVVSAPFLWTPRSLPFGLKGLRGFGKSEGEIIMYGK